MVQLFELFFANAASRSFRTSRVHNLTIFFLPYFEPIAARLYFEDDSIRTIQQAVAKVIDKMEELFDSGKAMLIGAELEHDESWF